MLISPIVPFRFKLHQANFPRLFVPNDALTHMFNIQGAEQDIVDMGGRSNKREMFLCACQSYMLSMRYYCMH